MFEEIRVVPARQIAPLAVGLPEAARIIGLSERTVRELVKAGRLPVSQPAGIGGKLLFRMARLEEFLASSERRLTEEVVE